MRTARTSSPPGNGSRPTTPPSSTIRAPTPSVLGDWREELIASFPGEIRIYTTTVPATTRRPCLMQDRFYRTYVATSGSGYNTPPQHSRPFDFGP